MLKLRELPMNEAMQKLFDICVSEDMCLLISKTAKTKKMETIKNAAVDGMS